MKKVLSIILCIGLCIINVMPVLAEEVSKEPYVTVEEYNMSIYSSNYFVGPTIRLNSTFGSESGHQNISTGSASGNISSIILNVRAGGDPFKLYLQAPDGTLFWSVIDTTGVIGVDNFNGKNLSGTWVVWIETLGIASTASISVRINYS